LAILTLLGVFVAYGLWAVGPGGAKYWLLASDGREALATVDEADQMVPADAGVRHVARNTNALGDHVLVRYSFSTNDGRSHRGEALYLGQALVAEGESLPVVYWVRDPAVSLPVNLLPEFRFDGLALFWVSSVAAVLVGLVVLVLRRWIWFRKSVARY
jgi:hypothetical protein